MFLLRSHLEHQLEVWIETVYYVLDELHNFCHLEHQLEVWIETGEHPGLSGSELCHLEHQLEVWIETVDAQYTAQGIDRVTSSTNSRCGLKPGNLVYE